MSICAATIENSSTKNLWKADS